MIPGEIIISDSVFQELDNKDGFNRNENLILKGKTKAVKNWKFTHSI